MANSNISPNLSVPKLFQGVKKSTFFKEGFLEAREKIVDLSRVIDLLYHYIKIDIHSLLKNDLKDNMSPPADVFLSSEEFIKNGDKNLILGVRDTIQRNGRDSRFFDLGNPNTRSNPLKDHKVLVASKEEAETMKEYLQRYPDIVLGPNCRKKLVENNKIRLCEDRESFKYNNLEGLCLKKWALNSLGSNEMRTFQLFPSQIFSQMKHLQI
jgi:hypothetical protein